MAPDISEQTRNPQKPKQKTCHHSEEFAKEKRLYGIKEASPKSS